MNFLSRKLRPAESAAANEAPQIVHREIEITVERTWTSVTQSNQVVETPPPEEDSVL